MERVRQAWRYLQLKFYGPPRPPFTVPKSYPYARIQSAAGSRENGLGRYGRRKNPAVSRSYIQKRPQKPKLCRNVKDYAIRLENLVSGLDRLEDAEQHKQSIAEQITEQAADEYEEDLDDSEPLDSLIGQQDIAEGTIRDELNELSKNADRILDSFEEQGDRSPLPTDLITQLQRYDDARVGFVQRRVSVSDEKAESDVLRKIEATLYLAANRSHNRGWIPTQARLRLMRNRKADIIKRRRIVEICKASMTSELRTLCRGEAATTLQSPAFRPESQRIRRLKRAARDML